MLFSRTTFFRWFLLIVATLSLAACAKPKSTLVVTVGGLGFSQMGDVRRAIARECPNADVVSAGAWDAYKKDLTPIIHDAKHRRIVLVGHSYGCKTIAQAAEQVPAVDLVVFIDPAWNDIPLPRNTRRYLWFQRSDFGIEREAKIVGAAGPYLISGGHNNIPHSPELISNVVRAVNATPDETAPPKKTAGKLASR